jgi:hypothetical protein
MMDFVKAITDSLRLPRWEVRERNGKRQFVPHRFPIKGGITSAEVLSRNVTATNLLFERLHSVPMRRIFDTAEIEGEQ